MTAILTVPAARHWLVEFTACPEWTTTRELLRVATANLSWQHNQHADAQTLADIRCLLRAAGEL